MSRNYKRPERRRIDMTSGMVPMIPVAIILIILAYLMHRWFG